MCVCSYSLCAPDSACYLRKSKDVSTFHSVSFSVQLYQQREMSGSNGSVVGEGGGAAVQIHIDAAHTNLQCVGEVPVEECVSCC